MTTCIRWPMKSEWEDESDEIRDGRMVRLSEPLDRIISKLRTRMEAKLMDEKPNIPSRTCIHPLSDAVGNPLYDGKPIIVQEHPEFSWPRDRRLRCAKPVPMGRYDRLCDEHYAAAGDNVSAYIEKVLGNGK